MVMVAKKKVEAKEASQDVQQEKSVVRSVEPKQTMIMWEAQEYVVRDKTAWWYVGLVVVGILLVALAVWLRWWTFLVVVILSVVALVIYTVRPPRIIHYSLSNKGITEDKIMHEYSEFKSFGFLQENGHFAIILNPRKRFSPRVTVYFPEAQGEEIIDALGARLPMEEVNLDILDKLIKFLRI